MGTQFSEGHQVRIEGRRWPWQRYQLVSFSVWIACFDSKSLSITENGWQLLQNQSPKIRMKNICVTDRNFKMTEVVFCPKSEWWTLTTTLTYTGKPGKHIGKQFSIYTFRRHRVSTAFSLFWAQFWGLLCLTSLYKHYRGGMGGRGHCWTGSQPAAQIVTIMAKNPVSLSAEQQDRAVLFCQHGWWCSKNASAILQPLCSQCECMGKSDLGLQYIMWHCNCTVKLA